MIALRRYRVDFLRLARRIGGVTGGLLILLSIPGIVSLWLAGDWAQGVPWLPTVVAGFSFLLFLLGTALFVEGMRDFMRFGLLARLRLRRRR